LSEADKDIIEIKKRRIKDYENAGWMLAIQNMKSQGGLAIRGNRSLEET